MVKLIFQYINNLIKTRENKTVSLYLFILFNAK